MADLETEMVGLRSIDGFEDQFNQLANNIRDVLWLYAADFSAVIYVSPAYERIWGRTLESLQANPYSFLDAIHSEDRAHIETVIRNEHERGFNLQYRIIRSDGEVRWIWNRGFRSWIPRDASTGSPESRKTSPSAERPTRNCSDDLVHLPHLLDEQPRVVEDIEGCVEHACTVGLPSASGQNGHVLEALRHASQEAAVHVDARQIELLQLV